MKCKGNKHKYSQICWNPQQEKSKKLNKKDSQKEKKMKITLHGQKEKKHKKKVTWVKEQKLKRKKIESIKN